MKRVKQHNAALKGYRLLNERKAAKARREPPPSPPNTIASGDIFGHLTALERAPDLVSPILLRRTELWVWACGLCGGRTTERPKVIKARFAYLGWVACVACYHDAGGWEAIAARERTSQQAPDGEAGTRSSESDP